MHHSRGTCTTLPALSYCCSATSALRGQAPRRCQRLGGPGCWPLCKVPRDTPHTPKGRHLQGAKEAAQRVKWPCPSPALTSLQHVPLPHATKPRRTSQCPVHPSPQHLPVPRATKPAAPPAQCPVQPKLAAPPSALCSQARHTSQCPMQTQAHRTFQCPCAPLGGVRRRGCSAHGCAGRSCAGSCGQG